MVVYVVVGFMCCDDIVCEFMVISILFVDGLLGFVLFGFMVGVCVVCMCVFMEVGGYWCDFFIGGEESVLVFDLVDVGWCIVYCWEVVMYYNFLLV